MANVVYPPTSLVTQIEHKTIFLAGSIEMGAARDWQQEVIDNYKNTQITFLNPRRQDWDSSWKQEFTDPNFYQQVNWELNALDKCNRILMYFDPATKSPISLLELGLYATSGKLLVVCPDGFWRKGNVEIVCEKYGIPMLNELEQVYKILN